MKTSLTPAMVATGIVLVGWLMITLAGMEPEPVVPTPPVTQGCEPAPMLGPDVFVCRGQVYHRQDGQMAPMGRPTPMPRTPKD